MIDGQQETGTQTLPVKQQQHRRGPLSQSYRARWYRAKRQKFYDAGLRFDGKPRKFKVHPNLAGLPPALYQKMYVLKKP